MTPGGYGGENYGGGDANPYNGSAGMYGRPMPYGGGGGWGVSGGGGFPQGQGQRPMNGGWDSPPPQPNPGGGTPYSGGSGFSQGRPMPQMQQPMNGGWGMQRQSFDAPQQQQGWGMSQGQMQRPPMGGMGMQGGGMRAPMPYGGGGGWGGMRSFGRPGMPQQNLMARLSQRNNPAANASMGMAPAAPSAAIPSSNQPVTDPNEQTFAA